MVDLLITQKGDGTGVRRKGEDTDKKMQNVIRGSQLIWCG